MELPVELLQRSRRVGRHPSEQLGDSIWSCEITQAIPDCVGDDERKGEHSEVRKEYELDRRQQQAEQQCCKQRLDDEKGQVAHPSRNAPVLRWSSQQSVAKH